MKITPLYREKYKNSSREQYVVIHTDLSYIQYEDKNVTAAVAQWVRALAPQAEDWVFESQPRQT